MKSNSCGLKFSTWNRFRASMPASGLRMLMTMFSSTDRTAQLELVRAESPAPDPSTLHDIGRGAMAVLSALATLQASIDGLRADLAARPPDRLAQRSRLSVADAALLCVLLPAIAGRLGSEPFCVRDLTEDPTLARILGQRSTRSIGRLLARVAGEDVTGYVVQRVGAEFGAATWSLRVSRVSNP